jgi:hypothetical protein
MTKRMNVEEAKSYWFGDDLTVCAMDGNGEFWGALPRREVLRGYKYLKMLEDSETIAQAQAVYEQYVADPDAPKLLPSCIINFIDEADQIMEFIESEIQQNSPRYVSLELEQFEQMSNVELYDLIKDEKFNLYESRFYRDESDMNVIYGQASLITDEWIPGEIAEAIGVPDTGEGFFYETVEFVYPDFSKFSRAFRDIGFEVVAESKEVRELSGY